MKLLACKVMSEEQLNFLLAKLKQDAGLKQRLQGAEDLDAVVKLAKEAGFDVGKADWLRYQAKQALEMSDEELERVAGGKGGQGKYSDNKRITDCCTKFGDIELYCQ